MSLAFAPVIGVLALFGLPLFAVFGAITALYFGVLDQDVELMMRNVAGSPAFNTRAVPRYTASNPSVLLLSGSTNARPCRNTCQFVSLLS